METRATELGLRLDQRGPADSFPGPLSFTFLPMMPSQPLRWSAFGAVLLAAPAVARSAQVPTRYRIDQTLTQEVDGSAAGQGKQTLSFKTSSFIKVSLTDSAGGKVMRVVVDSMKGDSTTPIPPAVLDSVKGAAYRAYISKDGRPGRLEATNASPAAAQVQGLLSDFFPWVRAGIRPGEAWADTSVTTTGAGSDTVTVRRIINYRAVPPEPKQPAKSIRVATDYTSQVAGSQPTPSGSARIEGSGNGKGSYLVSPEGHYLGGEWELSSALQLSASFTPKPVPISLRQTTKVSAIK